MAIRGEVAWPPVGRSPWPLTDLQEVAGLLPYVAADVRFVGDPVTFVVFDGHTEVKDGAGGDLRGVSFLEVESSEEDSLLVAECVDAGRVEWLTVRLP